MAAVPAPSSAGDQGPGVPSPVGKRASGRCAHIQQPGERDQHGHQDREPGRLGVYHCADPMGGCGMIPAG